IPPSVQTNVVYNVFFISKRPRSAQPHLLEQALLRCASLQAGGEVKCVERERQALLDFKAAMFIHDCTTIFSFVSGYLAPEYAIQSQVTRKLDVYSFGILLSEIVSGRCNINRRLPAKEREVTITDAMYPCHLYLYCDSLAWKLTKKIELAEQGSPEVPSLINYISSNEVVGFDTGDAQLPSPSTK
ncbi:hypothetical protein HN51_032329, partial [Arachis hypogaea]